MLSIVGKNPQMTGELQSMAGTTSKPRKAKATAPRKRAASRTQAPKNGVTHEIGQSSEVPAPPERIRIQPEPQIKHPYGNRPIYVFTPNNGTDPIVFPKIHTVPVDAKFMWKIYDLAEIFQSFEWMNLAGVPRDIQERVVDLPTSERTRFWSGWFNDASSPLDLDSGGMEPPGESSS